MSDSVPGSSTETIGDIQNYLADFNPKDSVISKSEPVLGGADQEDDPTEAGLTLGSADASGSGQYFVDQETGQYYFQSSNGETLTVVDADGPVTTGMLEGDDGSHEMDQDTDLAQVMGHSDLIAKGEPELPHNQVVLAGGGSDQYQTVTIVPNDTNSGEVSYVLIVQQNETQEKKGGVGGGEQMAVYDFETENDPDYVDEDMAMDDKAKVNIAFHEFEYCIHIHYTN